MRLSELNPKLSDGNILRFDCPCGQGHSVRVPLGVSHWSSSGEFPEKFSVSPSINVGCWHGWITDGTVS